MQAQPKEYWQELLSSAKSKQERYLIYRAYLDSEEWRAKRRRLFESKKKYKRVCYVCGAGDKLHVHHKTYKRLGNEYMMDLCILCADCHSWCHFLLRNKTNFNLSSKMNTWSIVKRVKRLQRSPCSIYNKDNRMKTIFKHLPRVVK